MQAKDIVLYQEYAVKYRGGEVALRVTEIRNIRDHNGVKNVVVGFTPSLGPDTHGTQIAVEVRDVIDVLANHQRLREEENQRQMDKRAKEIAFKDRQAHAVKLLAKAIGAQPVLARYSHDDDYVEWDENGPAVMRYSGNIEINRHALEQLIVFLEKIRTSQRYGWEPAHDDVFEDAHVGADIDIGPATNEIPFKETGE